MKAFKPLPSNHQWSKKNFSLLFKFLKLTEKKIFVRAVLWTTLFYYILIIVPIYTCIF